VDVAEERGAAAAAVAEPGRDHARGHGPRHAARQRRRVGRARDAADERGRARPRDAAVHRRVLVQAAEATSRPRFALRTGQAGTGNPESHTARASGTISVGFRVESPN
jgi:hypothetical protein